ALVNAWFDADVTSLASPVSRPCTGRDGRPAGCPVTRAYHHTQKAPHAAHAEPTIPVSATGPAGRPRVRYPNTTVPIPCSARNRPRRVRPARRLTGRRTRRPVAG